MKVLVEEYDLFVSIYSQHEYFTFVCDTDIYTSIECIVSIQLGFQITWYFSVAKRMVKYARGSSS
jgi:hypothetical protein